MSIKVDTKKYFDIDKTTLVKDEFNITVEDHAYLPHIDDIENDWLAFIAVPAFKLARKKHDGKAFSSFASIGTGPGLDVLAGAEILGAHKLGFTDLQESVVNTAAANVRNNLVGEINENAGNNTNTDNAADSSFNLVYGAGDLFDPFRGKAANGENQRFDVIYENLPNVPLSQDKVVTDSRNSGHYLEERQEPIPKEVHANMLDLHFLALNQVSSFLTKDGFILSLMGGRVSLDSFVRLGELAGVKSEIFTYGWKVQAEPEDVIGGYADQEAQGYGPFTFYRSEDLAAAFDGINVEASGAKAFEIESKLADKKLTATEAFEIWKKGGSIGHTVVVLKSYAK